MKIAVIGLKGLPSRGGYERVAEAIVRRLSNQHEFTVYCGAQYTPPDAVIPNVRLLRLPTVRGKHVKAFLLAILSAVHAVFLGRYDLIHVHGIETGFVIPLLRLRYQVVGTIHTQSYTAEKWGRGARLFMRAAERLFINFSSALTCITPVLMPYYERFRAISLIPNGVDRDPAVSLDRAKSTLEKHAIPEADFILFAAARIIPFKGCHLLLDAFRSLATDCHVVIIGDLDQMPEYGQHLRSLSDERVHFIPFIDSQAELMGLIKKCRLFVFPSTNSQGVEGMPMMLLEVASLGTPLLCSDIPQNVAVLDNHGYYFQSGGSADLGVKLVWALEHPAGMREKARDAQAHVRKNFLWDNIVLQYNAVFDRTAGSPTTLRLDPLGYDDRGHG